ncbi:MAG: sigma-70 family RNA polymerase sigma factor [Sedimentisphaerales bacterium]|nr:sigma-70 family RNA polymerase sigma factor [Sedimentisphaerales bacterium]
MAETESVLLSRFARTGDAEAFAEITRRHAGLVYGAALRVLADVDRAADVAQETFLQLTKDAHSVTGSLPGWLHRVATHKAIDQMRRDASRRRREAEYTADKPREVTDWKDLSRYVDEELNRLDNETREMLVAHFLQGQTTRQVALARGVSQATVSRRIDAGVTQLRAVLRKRGLLVTAGILSTLLGRHAAQAAPTPLMIELGKMALVGGHAAVGTGGASFIETSAGGLLAGVKANIVAVAAVAAVAVIGAGSVVTYRHATRPRTSESTIVTRSPASKTRSRATVAKSVSSPQPAAVTTTGSSDAAKRWTELISSVGNRTGGQGGQPTQQPGSQQATGVPPAGSAVAASQGGMGGMIGGAMMMGAVSPSREDQRPDPVGLSVGIFVSTSNGEVVQAGIIVEEPTGSIAPSEPNDSNDTGPDGK